MKKQILNLGKLLSKKELEKINGAVSTPTRCAGVFIGNTGQTCNVDSDCKTDEAVCFRGCCNTLV